MKNNLHNLYRLLPLLLLSALNACDKDKLDASAAPPEISGVTYLTNREVQQTSVNYGDWIIIKGQHLATTYKVDFSGVVAADSLTYADDTSVTVKIPPTLPAPADNPITVTTKYGTATYNFRILQPAPEILSVEPMAGAANQEITIRGYYFGGVTSVKFGDTPAEIVSNTKEEIKVKIPAGITTAYITVTTPSGTVQFSKIFGFKYEVFTDGLPAGWTYSPSSANVTYDATVTTPVRRGTNALKIEYKAAWSFLRLVKTAALSTTGYQGVKFSMYAPDNFLNKKVRIYLNGSTAATYTITVTKANEWIDYQLPFTNFNNPATITQIIFNEFSGTATFPRQIYVDDIGLY